MKERALSLFWSYLLHKWNENELRGQCLLLFMFLSINFLLQKKLWELKNYLNMSKPYIFAIFKWL